MAKLRAGVIGLGMGWNHLNGYMTHPDVEVVAIADRLESKLEAVKREYPGIPKLYSEGIDLIKNEKLDVDIDKNLAICRMIGLNDNNLEQLSIEISSIISKGKNSKK